MKKERAPKPKSKGFGKKQKVQPTEKKALNKSLVNEVAQVSDIEQVFIYAPPGIWDSIIKYYSNNFVNLEVYGSSLYTNLEEDYMQNAHVRNIIVFATTTMELQKAAEFIFKLSNLGISSDLISVAVVLLNGIPHDILNTFKGRTPVIKAMSVTTLTDEVLNNIIGHVIEKMAPYKTSTPIQPVTEKAKSRGMNLSNTDIVSVKEELARIKEAPLNRTRDVYATIETIINEHKDVMQMSGAMNEIPHMQYLDNISKEISGDIELLLKRGDQSSKERIVEAVKMKLFVSGLKARETETILNTIIERAEARAGTEAEAYRKAMAEYGELQTQDIDDTEISQLIGKRELGKQEVTEKIKSYASTVRQIQAPALMLAYTEDTLYEDLSTILSQAGGILTNDVENGIEKAMKHFKASKAIAMTKKNDYDESLRTVINKASAIIKNLTEIIEVDDILIDRLLTENKRLKNGVGRPIMIAESKFVEVASVTMRVPGTGLSEFLAHNNYDSNMVIYIPDDSMTEFERLEFRGQNPISNKAFLREDWDSKTQNTIIIEDADVNTVSNVLEKVKVIAGRYKKIVVIVDIGQQPALKNFLLKEIPIVTIWTDGEIDNLSKVINQLASMRAIKSVTRTVIINRSDYTESGKYKYQSLLGAQENRIGIVQIPAIPSEELDKPTHLVNNQVLAVVSTALNKL